MMAIIKIGMSGLIFFSSVPSLPAVISLLSATDSVETMVSSDETEEIISSDEVISEVTLSTSETSVAVPGVETEGALEDVLDDVAAGFDAVLLTVGVVVFILIVPGTWLMFFP